MTLAHVRALFSIEESRLQQTADTEMYQVTKFSVELSFTVHYFYKKKLVVSYQVYPKELFGTVFICSSLNLRNSQLADCGKRGSKSS